MKRKVTDPQQSVAVPFWRQSYVVSAGLTFIYFVLAVAAYWPVYPGDPNRIVGGPGGDPAQSAWFLSWTTYAISHGHNPLFTNWINVPFGANLTQNTLMPLLGLVTAPLTLLAGPVASFNLLAWLSFPLSAAAMFYVARRLKFSHLAAFVAGLLYGFSPYMMGQGEGHIMLTFVPLLPLLVLGCWHLIVAQRPNRNPYKLGAMLAGGLIAQFFIEPELVATTIFIVVSATILLALCKPREVARARVIYAVKGLAITALICIIVLGYPIWFMAAGPQHFTGPNFLPGNPYRSDLIGLIVPSKNQRFIVPHVSTFAVNTEQGDLSEVDDFIGLPLLAAICVALVVWRRNRWLVLCTVAGLCMWIGSLGPRLVVDMHKTGVILPFALITKIPFLQDMLPARLSLAEWFFMAFAVAIVVSEWQKARLRIPQHALKMGWPTWAPTVGLAVFAVTIILSLLPRWPYPTEAINEPSFFKKKTSLVANRTVLAYPLPIFSNDQFMLWQAESDMQFKLMAAYIQNPGPNGMQSQLPPLLNPPTVQEWLAYEQSSNLTGTAWKPVTTISTVDIRLYIKNYKVEAIVVNPKATNATVVTTQLETALGAPTREGGVVVWNTRQVY